MAELTTLTITWLNMDATLVEMTKVSKNHQQQQQQNVYRQAHKICC